MQELTKKSERAALYQAQLFACALVAPSFAWAAGSQNLIGFIKDVLDIVALVSALILVGKAYWGSTETDNRGEQYKAALTGFVKLAGAYLLAAVILNLAAKYTGSTGLKDAANVIK